jgi:hypothetical protein
MNVVINPYGNGNKNINSELLFNITINIYIIIQQLHNFLFSSFLFSFINCLFTINISNILRDSFNSINISFMNEPL